MMGAAATNEWVEAVRVAHTVEGVTGVEKARLLTSRSAHHGIPLGRPPKGPRTRGWMPGHGRKSHQPAVANPHFVARLCDDIRP